MHGYRAKRRFASGRNAQRQIGTRRTAQDRDEVKDWHLTCHHCGHVGFVEISINDLRDAIVDGIVYCSECGTVRELL